MTQILKVVIAGLDVTEQELLKALTGTAAAGAEAFSAFENCELEEDGEYQEGVDTDKSNQILFEKLWRNDIEINPFLGYLIYSVN